MAEYFGLPATPNGDTVYLADNGGTVYRTDDAGVNVTVVHDFDLTFTDIAVMQDGTVYASTFTTLYELDLEEFTATTIASLGDGANGMGADVEGNLYFSYNNSTSVSVFDLETNSFTSSFDLGRSSAGDLVISGEHLYSAASGSTIVTYDLAKGEVIDTVSHGIGGLYGIHMTEDGLIGYAGQNIYTVDPETGEVSTDEDGNAAPIQTLAIVGSVYGSAAAPVAEMNATNGADELFAPGDGSSISAMGGDDLLVGGLGEQTLRGGEGDDMLMGRSGDDTLDGGDGMGDTARYEAGSDMMRIEIVGEGEAFMVMGGSGERDTLIDIERLEMDDEMINLGQIDGIADIAEDDLALLCEMYIAYFNRAPDAEGLFYWAEQYVKGMTMPEIAASFFVQPESQATFPDVNDNDSLVNTAYQNLMERPPEKEGYDYWMNALESGEVSRSEFMLSLILGARDNPDPEAAADVRQIENKGDIALYYAAINGLTDSDENASTVMDMYERPNATESLREIRDLIDEYAEEAAATDGTGELVILADTGISDPFIGL